MTAVASPCGDAALRARAAEAWAFRYRVECSAAVRFARIADRLAAIDPASPVIAMAREAVGDEQRHAAGCARLARALGADDSQLPADVPVPEIAPSSLEARRALLYDVVAVACVSETESVATLTELLSHEMEPEVHALVHEIARDEVGHARLGWAHLAREAPAVDVSFLGRLIPKMLDGGGAAVLFEDLPDEDPALLRYGVAPRALSRALLVTTLENVIAPGLTQFGIDAQPLRDWIAQRDGARSAR
jgi:hypothetical protein